MIRRVWLRAALCAVAALAALSAIAWFVAVAALRAAVISWGTQARASIDTVDLREHAASGWPAAATLSYGLHAGPGGLPLPVTLDVVFDTSLSWLHPDRVRSRISQVVVTGQDGARFELTAPHWVLDSRFAQPDRVLIDATELRIAAAGHAVVAGTLSGEIASLAASLVAERIDLARSGLPSIPPPFGTTVQSARLAMAWPAGLPAPAATRAASAAAWRDAGGTLLVSGLAVRFGPSDLSAAAQLGLDAALRPAGTGSVSAQGLGPLLDALATAGVVPERSGQAAAGILALLGGGDGVRIPFSIEGGRIAAAGFPLARLPPFAWQPQEGH